VKVKLTTFDRLGEIINYRAYENPLNISPSNNVGKDKSNMIKFSVFDTATNGGKFFFNSYKQSCDLRSGFSRAKPKSKEVNEARRRKERMDFIEFYQNQYAYSPKLLEPLYCLNKLTTPKETVMKKKVQVYNLSILTYF